MFNWSILVLALLIFFFFCFLHSSWQLLSKRSWSVVNLLISAQICRDDNNLLLFLFLIIQQGFICSLIDENNFIQVHVVSSEKWSHTNDINFAIYILSRDWSCVNVCFNGRGLLFICMFCLCVGMHGVYFLSTVHSAVGECDVFFHASGSNGGDFMHHGLPAVGWSFGRWPWAKLIQDTPALVKLCAVFAQNFWLCIFSCSFCFLDLLDTSSRKNPSQCKRAGFWPCFLC